MYLMYLKLKHHLNHGRQTSTHTGSYEQTTDKKRLIHLIRQLIRHVVIVVNL